MQFTKHDLDLGIHLSRGANAANVRDALDSPSSSGEHETERSRG